LINRKNKGTLMSQYRASR